MTPEQLEAHRVRFEQAYTKRYGLPASVLNMYRDGPDYSIFSLSAAWQAYQWALADADRAQRAAPVSEVAHAPFKAMAQGEVDYSVDVFPIESTEFGSMMTIGAQEGAIYITKEQAMQFWNLADATPQPVAPVSEAVAVLSDEELCILQRVDDSIQMFAEGRYPYDSNSMPNQKWRRATISDVERQFKNLAPRFTALIVKLFKTEPAAPQPVEVQMQPTYFVKHPDESFSAADPQPVEVQPLTLEQIAAVDETMTYKAPK